MASMLPAINSRWRLPDHPELSGVEYRVVEQIDRNGFPWFLMENCATGSKFEVELAWFERRTKEVK